MLTAAWPALLLASVILLPWLGKAHTIDDTTFLLMAEHVLKDPLHPTAFEMLAGGTRIRLSSELVSGPATAYLLVPSVLLGGAEWAAHLVQYLLMLISILATVSLAFRLGANYSCARLAGILLASTPAVMVMATTSMADVPAMAFAVLGMERFVAWRQDHRWNPCFASAAFLALAALSRPHLILMLVVAFALEAAGLLPFFRGKSGHLGPAPQGLPCASRALLHMLPLCFAIPLIVGATFLTADPIRTGGHFVAATVSRFHLVNAASNMAAFFLHWLLVIPLGLLWIFLGIRWKRLLGNPALWLAAVSVLLISLLDQKDHRVPAFALTLAFIGAFITFDVFIDAFRRQNGIQFFLWVWLLIAFPAIAYVQLPCKYLISAAPSAAILSAFLVERSGWMRFMRWIAISAGVVLTLLIIAADAELGAFNRRIAREQITPRVAAGDRVWANGEWSFEWYALKAGAIPVAKQPPYPLPGDILVSSSATPHLPLELFPNRQLIAAFTETSHFGRIMTRPAGFYSNSYGFLPWTFRNGQIENITIFRIK